MNIITTKEKLAAITEYLHSLSIEQGSEELQFLQSNGIDGAYERAKSNINLVRNKKTSDPTKDAEKKRKKQQKIEEKQAEETKKVYIAHTYLII